jgi:hypothetical protein
VLDTRLLFVSAHLAAGHHQVKLRTQDFARIAVGLLKYVRACVLEKGEGFEIY